MSLILVVEQDATYTKRIQGALSAEGWTVQVVGDAEQAKAATARQRPDLVVVSTAAPGFAQVVGSFGRASGGPGAMALTESNAATPAGADGALAKPFTDEQLRASVRRVLSRGQKADAEMAAARAASSGTQLTSQDLFGDLLAEVEEEAAPKPRPAVAPRDASDDALDKQLQQTLSGVLGGRIVGKATVRPAAPKPSPVTAPTSAAPSAAAPSAPPAVAPTTTPAAAASTATAPPAAAPVAPSAPPMSAPRMSAPAAAASVAAAPPAPKPAAPPRRVAEPTPEVEDLLSQTLSGLGVGARPRPKPAAAAPPRVEPPTARAEPPRQEPRPPAPAVEPPAALPRTEPPPPSRAAAHAEVFGTQRVEVIRPAPSAAASAAPAAHAPSQFGQYALLDRVALGGMAEVWKARMKGMEGFQKTVAIKKILPHLTDSVDFVTMFIDEAKLAAQLNHPNIIHIYDLGKLEDDYYIAMEFVEGKDLRSILNTARKRELPLPIGLALLVAARLASGLDYAHRKRDFDNRELGLVHRDVSPQNVLISYEGDIKLCDFGIVKAVAKASKTQMGALKGKLQYMSPEQAWGRVVDARSDIFSLGSCLFEMLTGRRLFAGESEISVLEAVRECRIQNVRDLEPSVPEAVEAIVKRALAKDPDDRYQTAGEMQKELEAVLYTFKPTPDQGELAAYMHRLFGAEAAVPAAQPVAATASGGATAASAQVPAVVPLGTVTEVEESKRPAWLIPAIAAAAIVVIGLVIFFMRGSSASAPATSPPQAATSGVAPAAAPATAGAVAPAALPAAAATNPADLQKKLEQQLAAKEDQLKAQLAEQRQKVEAELKAQQKPAPGAVAAAPSVAPKQAAAPPPAPAATTPKVAEQTPPPAAPPAQAAPPAADTPAPAPPPAAAPAKVPEPAAPAAPSVSEGDMVPSGTPGLHPPAFVSASKPEYPPLARRLGVQGTVVVSVLVDESGTVSQTRLVRGVPQNVGLNEAAVAAAKSAHYRPATLNGVRVKTWANLSIPFKL